MLKTAAKQFLGVELTVRGSINSMKLQYFDHINRRDESVEKLILQGLVESSRGRGRHINHGLMI